MLPSPEPALFRFQDPAIVESSGLAAATRGDWLLTHQDGGNGARVLAVDRDGLTVATWTVPGVQNIDWEDMALAPDERGVSSVWLADIGDNEVDRDEVQLHRVEEPEPGATTTGPATTYRFTYADAPHDSETLLVLPGGRRIAVVTKEYDGSPAFYAADLVPDAPQVLRRVAALDLEPSGTPGGPLGPLGQLLPTGGAVGEGRFAVRTYTDVYEWPLAGDLEAALTVPPVRTPLPRTGQGEAIAYDRDGSLLTSAEGKRAPVHRVAAADLPRTAPPAEAPTDDGRTDRRPLVAVGVAAAAFAAVLAALQRRSRRRAQQRRGEPAPQA